MFSEVKLNFTQPGKDQWRAHTAEMEVRLNRALSPISPGSLVCSVPEVGTRWKGRSWDGESGDDRWAPPIHSSSDAFSHLFDISRVVFLWASLRDIQAGEFLHLKGQEGEEFTREVHLTRVVKCGCINYRAEWASKEMWMTQPLSQNQWGLWVFLFLPWRGYFSNGLNSWPKLLQIRKRMYFVTPQMLLFLDLDHL